MSNFLSNLWLVIDLLLSKTAIKDCKAVLLNTYDDMSTLVIWWFLFHILQSVVNNSKVYLSTCLTLKDFIVLL